MAAIHLFTWNLGKTNAATAHQVALDHLALLGTKGPFIACLQELPATSSIALARRKPQPQLASSNIAVVSTLKLVRGLALVHHPDLALVGTPVGDEDEEFVAAVFQRPADPKKIAVIGLHAKSKVDMQRGEDHGGSRALLRHAIHALGLTCDHHIVLGDFNSQLTSREVQSWHGFYAISTLAPVTAPSAARRRGFAHPPLYALSPSNNLIGTFVHDDSGGSERQVLDFIAVDGAARPGAISRILVEVAGASVWDSVEQRPSLSDHLPVEGMVDI